MRIASIAVAATLCASPAFAALSGFYDSAEKVAAIFASEQVGNALRQAPIQAIENTGTRADGADEWLVKTQDCTLKLYLEGEAPIAGMVGKTTYKVVGLGPCE